MFSDDQGSCALSLTFSYRIKPLFPTKIILAKLLDDCHIFSEETSSQNHLLYGQAGSALRFGNTTSSQDGTQLGVCFLLQWEHPGLPGHVASLLPWPGSRLLPSVRLAAHDITGSCCNHNATLLGTKPMSFLLQPIHCSTGQSEV